MNKVNEMLTAKRMRAISHGGYNISTDQLTDLCAQFTDQELQDYLLDMEAMNAKSSYINTFYDIDGGETYSDSWIAVCPKFLMIGIDTSTHVDHTTPDVIVYSFDKSEVSHWSDDPEFVFDADLIESLIVTAVAIVASIQLALQNRTSISFGPSVKRNKKGKVCGRNMLNKQTQMLSLSVISNYGTNNGGGGGGTKKPHVRGGHERTYKSGKKIWIEQCSIHGGTTSAIKTLVE